MINERLQDGLHYRLLIGAIHAQNLDNEKKEMMLEDMIKTIDKKYTHPKCIYIDLNSDVNKSWAQNIMEG